MMSAGDKRALEFLVLIAPTPEWLKQFIINVFTCNIEEIDGVKVPIDVKQAWIKWLGDKSSEDNKPPDSLQEETRMFETFKLWFNQLFKTKDKALEFLETIDAMSLYTDILKHASTLETTDDNGKPIPRSVKKQWQQWCLQNHPDKGGTEEVYQNVSQNFADFKEWFRFLHQQTSLECQLECQLLGSLTKKAEDTKNMAEDMLKEQRYNEAIRLSNLAREQNNKYRKAKGRSSSSSYKQLQERFAQQLDDIEKEANKGLAKASCSSVNHNDIQTFMAQITDLKKQNELLLKEKDDLKANVALITEEKTNLNTKIQNLQTEILDLKNQTSSETFTKQTHENDFEAQNKILMITNKTLERKTLKVMVENMALQEQLQQAQQERDTAEKMIQSVRACVGQK